MDRFPYTWPVRSVYLSILTQVYTLDGTGDTELVPVAMSNMVTVPSQRVILWYLDSTKTVNYFYVLVILE